MKRTTKSRRRRARREGGFTLIELMAVLVILALTFSIVVPNLEGLSPTYTLRGGAREVGSQVELARGESVAKRRSFAIAYAIDEGWHAIVLPAGYGEGTTGAPAEADPDEPGAPSEPAEANEPSTPMSQREMLQPEYLPRGVKFKNVLLPGGEEETAGMVYVEFDPFGSEGSHIVHLVNERDELIAITFHATAGTITYDNTEREFEEFEGTEEEYLPPEKPE